MPGYPLIICEMRPGVTPSFFRKVSLSHAKLFEPGMYRTRNVHGMIPCQILWIGNLVENAIDVGDCGHDASSLVLIKVFSTLFGDGSKFECSVPVMLWQFVSAACMRIEVK